MASIILSSRQRIELENFVLHASSARECCRALTVLWLAEGETPDQVAELLHVSRQTVYNWAGCFQQREGLDLRSRLADGTFSPWPLCLVHRADSLLLNVGE